MATLLSKLQLNAVLSALDGQPRNPNSRQAALKRIGRHAETLGLELDALLTKAQGFVDGRMDAAAFVAALRAPAASPHEEEPIVADEDAAAEQPVPGCAPTADSSENVATDGPTATHCPSCGRKLRAPQVADQPRAHRDGSKEAQVIAMLRRPEGATIAQIMSATGWQSHTVRGLFSGALKKRHGLTITSDKPQGAERTYRIHSQ